MSTFYQVSLSDLKHIDQTHQPLITECSRFSRWKTVEKHSAITRIADLASQKPRLRSKFFSRDLIIRVNIASSINDEPTIALFYQADAHSPVTLLDSKFPREGATVFCDPMRKAFAKNEESKSYTIRGGDLEALKEILKWIKECVNAKKVEKFQDVSS
jgi:hypothetical protein